MSEASERLRFLADWFDAKYQDAGTNDEVQRDLRRFADEFDRLTAENERLTALTTSNEWQTIQETHDLLRRALLKIDGLTAELAEAKADNHDLVEWIDNLESEIDADALELSAAEVERDDAKAADANFAQVAVDAGAALAEARDAARTILTSSLAYIGTVPTDDLVAWYARWPWLEETT